MKVLITGGRGFIGAWILRRLAARRIAARIFDVSDDRHIVREIAGDVADKAEWRVGDVSVARDVEAAAEGCDAAIHLAGLLTPACKENPLRGAQVNLMGAINIFEAARRLRWPRVVYASTAGVFGPDDGARPFPTTHYGAFKLASEGCARAYWADHSVSSVGFRPFVVYGPGREIGLSAGPSLAARAAARGESYVIPYTGLSGLIYVDDVAAAFEAALLSNLPGASVFNLGGVAVTIDEAIAEIKRQVPGARITSEGPPLPTAGEIAEDDLYQKLPGLKKTSLADGLRATIAHYRA